MRLSQPGVVNGLPRNEATVGHHSLLRVQAGPGPLLHLAPRADVFDGAAARPAAWSPLALYDDELLMARVWTTRTMCGLRWSTMATHAAEVELATGDQEFQRDDYVCPACGHYSLTELP